MGGLVHVRISNEVESTVEERLGLFVYPLHSTLDFLDVIRFRALDTTGEDELYGLLDGIDVLV